jgi:hypothetical protein
MIASISFGNTLNFDHSEGSTGSLIEGVRNISLTTNVPEIVGLKITARSDNEDHQLNANADGIGINVDSISDEPARFENGEKMILSFDKNMLITRFDFRFFEDHERFFIEHGSETLEITWDMLSNKNSDYIDTNVVVTANTDIAFYTVSTNVIAAESLELQVLENDHLPPLTLTPSNSMLHLSAEVEAPSERRFSLDASNTLEMDSWNSISTFSVSTNWVITPTEDKQFFITSALD